MSGRTASRFLDDYDGVSGVERSFRLIFPENQEIVFFADNDEDKAKWYVRYFRSLDCRLTKLIGYKYSVLWSAIYRHGRYGQNSSGSEKRTYGSKQNLQHLLVRRAGRVSNQIHRC